MGVGCIPKDNRQITSRTKFAVIEIRTGKVLFRGPGLHYAAVALVPGSCCGEGKTVEEAIGDAQRRARAFAR
jgi:hypothetical protein